MLKKRILLIEDEPAISKMMKDKLELNDYEVETAFTSTEAINKLKEKKFDLITWDIQIPLKEGKEEEKEEGYRVRQFQLNTKQLKDIPVIAVTVLGLEGKKVCNELGISEYIRKPFDMNTLVEKVKSIIV